VSRLHVTVAVPTRNRAERLRHTLTRVANLHPPPADTSWDLLIVDNRSTDATRQVITEFRARVPLSCVDEPALGIAHARNAVVRAARGEYILWIDDDVSVEPEWMVEYVAAIRTHPDAALFGGPIGADFEPTPPAWLLDILPQVASAYGLRDLGPTPVALRPDLLPFGSNYATRTALHRRYSYDVRLGHHGAHVMVGEESKVFRAMLEDGQPGWWVPSARVRHFIPRSRQTWTDLSARWYAAGVATVLQAPPDSTPRFLGRPLWLWKLALQRQARYALRRLRYPKVQLVPELREARSTRGALEAYRLRASDTRPAPPDPPTSR
jgi:glucosyl-dolichyl phosphate glucuronosyltransferase